MLKLRGLMNDFGASKLRNMSYGWWLALQTRYDLAIAREKIAEKLTHIHWYAPQLVQA
jgi:plasmid maintenance system antidote protein VapI